MLGVIGVVFIIFVVFLLETLPTYSNTVDVPKMQRQPGNQYNHTRDPTSTSRTKQMNTPLMLLLGEAALKNFEHLFSY
ncbi:hypothetical protein BDB00DRAFT_794309 [Zychaea mexicana]|uniref:uncharacterized protein n=1 Tax=Zychaea mexicana TaxID=64656 RepID=UPI0022FEC4D6|nr:uncharacterized protein BDB00DRAFT_794309 [Zychaea mexicana]KAI9499507.1 hypothetical protein BDB00DRAFT_794309 [Zychaea mexicana]